MWIRAAFKRKISVFSRRMRQNLWAGSAAGQEQKKGVMQMAVRLNENKELVAQIREGLKKKGGYCPCRLERTEENKCMCREFREQIADPDFEGYCHCMLYYKEKEEK